jgi:hypothetical protein
VNASVNASRRSVAAAITPSDDSFPVPNAVYAVCPAGIPLRPTGSQTAIIQAERPARVESGGPAFMRLPLTFDKCSGVNSTAWG